MGSPEDTAKHPHNWRVSKRQLSKLDTLLCTLGFTGKCGQMHWHHLLSWEHRQNCRLLYELSAGRAASCSLPDTWGSSHSTSLSLLLFPSPVGYCCMFQWEKSNFYIVVYKGKVLFLWYLLFVKAMLDETNSRNRTMQKHKANKWFQEKNNNKI